MLQIGQRDAVVDHPPPPPPGSDSNHVQIPCGLPSFLLAFIFTPFLSGSDKWPEQPSGSVENDQVEVHVEYKLLCLALVLI